MSVVLVIILINLVLWIATSYIVGLLTQTKDQTLREAVGEALIAVPIMAVGFTVLFLAALAYHVLDQLKDALEKLKRYVAT